MFQIVFIYADPLRFSGFLSLGPATWCLAVGGHLATSGALRGARLCPPVCTGGGSGPGLPSLPGRSPSRVSAKCLCPRVAQLPAEPSPSWQLVPAWLVLARAPGSTAPQTRAPSLVLGSPSSATARAQGTPTTRGVSAFPLNCKCFFQSSGLPSESWGWRGGRPGRTAPAPAFGNASLGSTF